MIRRWTRGRGAGSSSSTSHSCGRWHAGSRTAASRIDDLVQIGTIGLIRAVDRFERRRGCPLEAYAALSIVGEIKRHLRDHAAPLREVPRRLQNGAAGVRGADRELAGRLGRTPTLARAGRGLRPARGRGRPRAAGERGTRAAAAPRSRTRPAPRRWNGAGLARLQRGRRRSRRGRRRAAAPAGPRPPAPGAAFFGDLSQAEVGRALGISQVHVSRLERAALARLRGALDADATHAELAGARLASVVGAASNP